MLDIVAKSWNMKTGNTSYVQKKSGRTLAREQDGEMVLTQLGKRPGYTLQENILIRKEGYKAYPGDRGY